MSVKLEEGGESFKNWFASIWATAFEEFLFNSFYAALGLSCRECAIFPLYSVIILEEVLTEDCGEKNFPTLGEICPANKAKPSQLPSPCNAALTKTKNDVVDSRSPSKKLP